MCRLSDGAGCAQEGSEAEVEGKIDFKGSRCASFTVHVRATELKGNPTDRVEKKESKSPKVASTPSTGACTLQQTTQEEFDFEVIWASSAEPWSHREPLQVLHYCIAVELSTSTTGSSGTLNMGIFLVGLPNDSFGEPVNPRATSP